MEGRRGEGRSAEDVLESVVRFDGLSPNSRKLNSHWLRRFASAGEASRIWGNSGILVATREVKEGFRMDTDLLLSVLFRWIHVGTAIVLVGGTSFMKFVAGPVLQGQSPELTNSIRSRWKKFVHGGIALLLLSGFINYFRAMSLHKGDGLYHGLIGTKIILAFVVFFFASALVGRSAGTQKFRDNSGKWTAVVLLLSSLIIAMSGVVKVRGVPAPKASVAATEPAADDSSQKE